MTKNYSWDTSVHVILLTQTASQDNGNEEVSLHPSPACQTPLYAPTDRIEQKPACKGVWEM